MNTKQLGNSDLQITPIGFGAWAIGGSGWQFGWGEQDARLTSGGLVWVNRASGLIILGFGVVILYGLMPVPHA